MKIMINESNRKKIETLIEQAEYKATARTITFSDIQNTVIEVQEKLDTVMLKKDQKGVVFNVDEHAHKFPASYQYSFKAESTYYLIKKVCSGWALIYIARNLCRPSKSQRLIPEFTDEHKKAMVDFIISNKKWNK